LKSPSARLSRPRPSATRQAGGEILITSRACAELRDGVRADPFGELTLQGFAQPQAAFRLVEV